MHFPEEYKITPSHCELRNFLQIISVKLLLHYNVYLSTYIIYQRSLRFNQIVVLENVLYQQAKMLANKSCYRKLNLSSNLIIQCITYRVLKPTSLYTIKTFIYRLNKGNNFLDSLSLYNLLLCILFFVYSIHISSFNI